MPMRSALLAALLLPALSGCSEDPAATGPPPPVPSPSESRPLDPGITFETGCLAQPPIPNPIGIGGTPLSGIPAIFDPEFLTTADADYMNLTDRVLGLEIDGVFLAFPAKILNYHEVVNFSIEGSRYNVTWCPLSFSFVALRNPNWNTGIPRKNSFMVSGALMDNNLVLWDVETQSTWNQVLAVAYDGPSTGGCLSLERNAVATTWGLWKTLHPETVVLTNQAGRFDSNIDSDIPPHFYNTNPYREYWSTSMDPPHPISNPDNRLERKRVVLGVHGPNGRAAVISDKAVAGGMVGGAPVVVFRDPASETLFAFENNLGGVERFFESSTPGEDGLPRFQDLHDGTIWSLDGIALEGPQKGKRLAQMPSMSVYWFVWAAFFPDSPILEL